MGGKERGSWERGDGEREKGGGGEGVRESE